MEEKKHIEPIDFTKIAKTLWQHRKLYYRVLPVVLIGTYLIMVCIPRYYKCTVSLAPETGVSSMGSSLGSIASQFGLGGFDKMGSTDAINSELYPDVISSKKFIAELMTVDIKTQKGDIACNYYTYLRDKQKAAWWNVILNTVTEWVKPTPKDTVKGDEKLSVFNLTKRQNDLFMSVQSKIRCQVDKKTDVVSITMEDQDPLVCATMADATCKKLQAFIIDYRTNKARIDHDYYEKLYKESKAEYEKAQQAYARYVDAHNNATMALYKTKIESLEDNMQEKYNIYTTLHQQFQATKAKLQEATPAFTVIETASVPIKPAGPKRMLFAFGMTVLTFFILSLKILLKGS